MGPNKFLYSLFKLYKNECIRDEYKFIVVIHWCLLTKNYLVKPRGKKRDFRTSKYE
jgi:hypothetical protein